MRFPIQLLALLLTGSTVYGLDSQVEFFESKVRPLLLQECADCHGPDKQKGGLRLDHGDLIKSGGESGPALTPGDPDKSRMILGVRYEDVNFQMPPKKKLSDAQVAVLEKWITDGAYWPDEPLPDDARIDEQESFPLLARKENQWAFQPVQAPPPPRTQDESWVKNPVDAFVLKKLEVAGLQPNPKADRRTLIRRAYFDLVGLPPTPAEVEAFVNDPSDSAFEDLVDQLLTSPHFGERWARKWMDLVRYAETLGHEFDYTIQNAWRYRDYLIRAFNDDIPYDQVIREHIAGDTLQNPRRHPESGLNESAIATGFYWFTQQTHSPVDIRQYQADMVDNQIDVFTKTFLGLTVACARCHDHKFDPITTRDFYSLYGTLTSSRYQQIDLTHPDVWESIQSERQEWLKKFRKVQAKAWLEQLPELKESLLESALKVMRGEKLKGAASAADEDNAQPHWAEAWVQVLLSGDVSGKDQGQKSPPLPWTNRDDLALENWTAHGQAWDLVTSQAGTDRWTPEAGWIFNLNPGPKSAQLSRKLQGSLRSPTFELKEKFIHLRVRGQGSRINLIIDNFNVIRNPIYGDLKKNINMPEGGWVRINASMWQGRLAYLECLDKEVGDFSTGNYPADAFLEVDAVHFSDSPTPPTWMEPSLKEVSSGLISEFKDQPECEADLQKRVDLLAERFEREILQWGGLAEKAMRDASTDHLAKRFVAAVVESPVFRSTESSEQWTHLVEEWKALESTIPSPVYAPGMIEGDPRSEYVYIRGNPRNYGEVAHRNFLEAFLSKTERQDEQSPFQGSGRREWAEFLTDPRNPLSTRVAVNRVWSHLFGQGISPSVDNFGELGYEPTHPELLDFLTQWYVTQGWSNKKLIRLLMTSSAYQMSSYPGDETAERLDPNNELLHRFRLRRMDGEALRDKILALAGRLDPELYGPSTAIHLTPFMDGRGRPGQSGPLDGDGRRSVYVEVRRNFLSPMMLAFDTPQPSSTVGQRSVSNVPAQALILMNDPFVHQQTERWAQRLLDKVGSSSESIVETAFQMAFGRPPEMKEKQTVLRFLNQYDKPGADLSVQAVSDFLHALITSKEFIFIP